MVVVALFFAGVSPHALGADETAKAYPPLSASFSFNQEAPPIFRAVAQGGTEKLQQELANSPELNVRTPQGMTPLILALSADANLLKVQLLVAAGAKTNFPDGNGNTPLYYALRRNKPEVATFLLEHSADVKQLTVEGHTALRIVTEFWMKDLIMPVLMRGGDFKEDFRYGSLIHYAAAYQHRSLIEWLLQQGESIDRVFPVDGITPLIAAVRRGTDNAVRVVLEFHPQINAQDKAGWTALMHAVALDKMTIATRLMQEKEIDLKLCAKDGTSLYQIAGRRGYVELQKELVQDGLAAEKITLPSVLSEFVTLAPAKRIALTMAAFELYLHCEEIDSLGGKGSDTDRAHAASLLGGTYRLNNAQALKEKIRFYLEKGERAELAEAIEAAKLSDDEFRAKLKTMLDDPVRLNELRKSRKLLKAGGEACPLAWDLCHHNALVVLGARAKWLSEEEAWEQLLAAAELFKSQCPDWTTVGEAMRTKLVGTFPDPTRAEAMLRLFTNRMDTSSPWVLTPLTAKK